MSFGVSSVTLLHILDYQLKNQTAKTGRTGFQLLVVHIDTSAVEQTAPNPSLISNLQARFPDHSYAVLPVKDVFEETTSDAKPQTSGQPEEQAEPHATSTSSHLSTLLASLPSATALADTITTLRTRLLTAYAAAHACEAILWGDSTTRLAERTLSETAKGRGFSLPWSVADGPTPGGIMFNYPLRDLLKKELLSHAEFVRPPLTEVMFEESKTGVVSTSSKTTTIDDLMRAYFESVEENYPSIVANVVRTATKLEPAGFEQSDARCQLCGMPVPEGRFGIHGWGGDQHDAQGLEAGVQKEGLCYGCTRSVPRGVGLPP
ncbi:uncharacterized protein BDZ99DRAFT_465942 [Mytilinidion resinicola]|uniref:Cytoplasmic tRNA 2-thiolation protein 2 n=1 Tax=Mytilinidion resinicola TaxID=574789 RepID=A0A6A6YBX6_9PEZI|nr:uncharacterized protein BDZ99DRAFT_465942 [Mytilinidion resinicola]KAF2806312.1 hypothetical protein BDZ99DRAFT_465942 [Mytilinidion resinicola]